MNVAVLSLTRDRLAYSQRNFERLRQHAGTGFDLYVLDNGSTDGTREWLDTYVHVDKLHLAKDNLGICPALNLLLDEYLNPADYDAIVRFDNDCEVWQDGILAKVCEVAVEHDVIVAPTVLGLRNPPASHAETWLGQDILDETGILGGVFMAIPAHLFVDGFRYDESSPPWGGDEYICSWWRERGGRCGYLRGWEVTHDSNRHDGEYPAYFQRKTREIFG